MKNINELIQDRNELKSLLRDIDNQIATEVFNMDNAILQAWCDGIIKFNFPLPSYVAKELKKRF